MKKQTQKQNAYESFLVVDGTKTKEQIDEIVSKFRELIKKKASSFDGEDIWGKRRLAYEINHKTEGYYVLYYFTSDADFPAELERQYRITDGVLRFLVVRNEDGFKPDLTKSLAPRDGIKREEKKEAPAKEAEEVKQKEEKPEETVEVTEEVPVADKAEEPIVEETKEEPVVKASEEEKPKRKPRAKKAEVVAEEESPKEEADDAK